MQEHIRRAHPEHYIPKLPATEESFLLMINTPPSETRNADSSPAPNSRGMYLVSNQSRLPSLISWQAFQDRRSYHPDELSNPGTPRHIDDLGHSLQGAASAAAALAELGSTKSERDSVDGVSVSTSLAF